MEAQDKGLVIKNYQNEEVWISGGKVITPKWKKYDVNPSKRTNIYKATISTVTEIPGLHINNKRGI